MTQTRLTSAIAPVTENTEVHDDGVDTFAVDDDAIEASQLAASAATAGRCCTVPATDWPLKHPPCRGNRARSCDPPRRERSPALARPPRVVIREPRHLAGNAAALLGRSQRSGSCWRACAATTASSSCAARKASHRAYITPGEGVHAGGKRQLASRAASAIQRPRSRICAVPAGIGRAAHRREPILRVGSHGLLSTTTSGASAGLAST